MNGKENELGDKWSLRIYFSHLSNLISRCIYIYIYGSGGGVQLRRHIALEPWEGGREGREGFHARITRDQRKVH